MKRTLTGLTALLLTCHFASAQDTIPTALAFPPVGVQCFGTLSLTTSLYEGDGECAAPTFFQDCFYTWAPPPGDYELEIITANFDTQLAIYFGTAALAPCLAYDDDSGVNLLSKIACITVLPSDNFLIQVGGFGTEEGWFCLEIRPCGDGCQLTTFCSPMDDNCESRPTELCGYFHAPPLGLTGLHLECTQGPPNQFGLFLVSSGFSKDGIGLGNGRLCLGGGSPFGRYVINGSLMNSIGQFDLDGVLINLVGNSDSTSPTNSGYDIPLEVPSPVPGPIVLGDGQTYYFQVWHRDSCSDLSNFSNGVAVTF